MATHSAGTSAASARMAPSQPAISACTSVVAEPASTVKSSGVRATYSAICPMSEPESLMPTMFGCAASRSTASGSRFTPVNIVTL